MAHPRDRVVSHGLTPEIVKHFADGNEHTLVEVAATCGHLIPPEVAMRRARTRLSVARSVAEMVEIGRLDAIRSTLYHLGATPLGAAYRERWTSFRLPPDVVHGQVRGERTHNSTLTDDAVRAIRRRVADGETQRSLAEEFGVHSATISKIVHRERWGHVA